jgi:hypothetical protein
VRVPLKKNLGVRLPFERVGPLRTLRRADRGFGQRLCATERLTYGCACHRKRGTTICRNGVRVKQDLIDKALQRAIGEALDERIIELAVEKALLQLRVGR